MKYYLVLNLNFVVYLEMYNNIQLKIKFLLLILCPVIYQRYEPRHKKQWLTAWVSSTGSEVIKLFSCSTQLSMKFSLLINMKMPTIVGIFIFISREIFKFSLLINMKMPTLVGIFIFISREIFMPSYVKHERICNCLIVIWHLLAWQISCSAVEHKKSFITWRPGS